MQVQAVIHTPELAGNFRTFPGPFPKGSEFTMVAHELGKAQSL